MATHDDNESESDVGCEVEEVGFQMEQMQEDGSHTPDSLYLDAFGEGSKQPIITDPKDGLPRPADEGIVAAAPKLTIESFVCLADESVWVERREKFEYQNTHPVPQHATDSLLGGKILNVPMFGPGSDRPRKKFSKGEVEFHEDSGLHIVREDGGVYVVDPIRPQCQHLAQMVVDGGDLDGIDEIQPIHTYCKKFVSVTGSFMSLMDRAVFSCSERSPQDTVSAQKIRDRIRRKIEEGKERKMLPMFKKSAAPAPVPFAGQKRFDRQVVSGPCDPAMKPWGMWRLEVGPATEFGVSSCDSILFVGSGASREDFTSKTPSEVAFFSFVVSEGDYAPESVPGSDLAAFCEQWPNHAKYPYLAYSLESTPRHIAQELYWRAHSVYVCALDPRDAAFGAALVAREMERLGAKGASYEKFRGSSMRAEQARYLERTT